jgi:hypothetical protein
MLQETSALACSLGIAALGGLVLVQPYLVGSAVALLATGVIGLRAGGRIRRLTTLDRQAADVGGAPADRVRLRGDD